MRRLRTLLVWGRPRESWGHPKAATEICAESWGPEVGTHPLFPSSDTCWLCDLGQGCSALRARAMHGRRLSRHPLRAVGRLVCTVHKAFPHPVIVALIRLVSLQVFTGAYMVAVDIIHFLLTLFPVCASDPRPAPGTCPAGLPVLHGGGRSEGGTPGDNLAPPRIGCIQECWGAQHATGAESVPGHTEGTGR